MKLKVEVKRVENTQFWVLYVGGRFVYRFTDSGTAFLIANNLSIAIEKSQEMGVSTPQLGIFGLPWDDN